MTRSIRFHPVCEAARVAPGRTHRCELAGREILVCNVGGELHAVSARCSHAAWPLRGEDLAGARLRCGHHGACFDVRDGSVVAGPARKPLDRYPLRIRDAWIEVGIASAAAVDEEASESAARRVP